MRDARGKLKDKDERPNKRNKKAASKAAKHKAKRVVTREDEEP